MHASDDPQRSDKYTAVIFVHGMGRQSQYENLGQLLESLEDQASAPESGVLRQFQARTEPPRAGGGEDVPFLQFDRFATRRHRTDTNGRWRFKGRFRAYEAYWSPVTARGAPPWRVATWALRQLAKPEATRHASWRQFTHLRIARLHRLMAETPRPADQAAARHQDYLFASLLAHIQRFRGHEGARFRQSAGTAAEAAATFAAYAVEKVGSAATPEQVREMVARWDAVRLPVEDLAVALSRHLRLIGLALVVFVVGLAVDAWRQGLELGAMSAIVALTLGAVLLAVFGGQFLARTFSDVYIWNSNQAHDRDHARRQEVLTRTRALFEHVVCDAACKRVVIVAHSLGTPITLETLALIGRRNAARAGSGGVIRMSKVSHLFTLGSPIDKIFYFFQTRETQTYRAGRLNDDLRGTLSQEPFFRDGEERIKWVNFWDHADIVSDPLYSPLGNRTDGADILTAGIENFAVENGSSFSAWKSHVGYLDNPEVAECIAEAFLRDDTIAPRLSPSSRDKAVGAARSFALRWTPGALLAGALAAAFGFGGLGALIALAPAAVLGFRHLISDTPERRFKRMQRRARLKARSLVAAPPGD